MREHHKCFWRFVCASWALIFIGALIYNYYEASSTSYIESSNDDTAIEQALEQIPTCTSDDRRRQRALLHTLQVWTQFAHKHHIRYWIAYGTLVGYVQRRGLLPQDGNIDVSIMAQDTSQLAELRQFNVSSDYELRVHPQWFIPEEYKRSYFRSEGIHFVAPNARFIFQKELVCVDIWPTYDYHPKRMRFLKNSEPMLTEYDAGYKWKSSPKEWIFPLQECFFSGIKVWCPVQPENKVADIYGTISLKMSSSKCVNGSWIESEEYRLAKEDDDET